VTDVTAGQGQDGAELSAADEQLLRELTERARTGGLKLTGEGVNFSPFKLTGRKSRITEMSVRIIAPLQTVKPARSSALTTFTPAMAGREPGIRPRQGSASAHPEGRPRRATLPVRPAGRQPRLPPSHRRLPPRRPGATVQRRTCRRRLQHPDHPQVLINRNDIAGWTARCGDGPAALRLLRELLPDLVRVLGPDHPELPTTRNNIVALTAQSGGDAGQEPEADPDGPEGKSETSGS
jgi:hypothetical protein